MTYKKLYKNLPILCGISFCMQGSSSDSGIKRLAVEASLPRQETKKMKIAEDIRTKPGGVSLLGLAEIQLTLLYLNMQEMRAIRYCSKDLERYFNSSGKYLTKKYYEKLFERVRDETDSLDGFSGCFEEALYGVCPFLFKDAEAHGISHVELPFLTLDLPVYDPRVLDMITLIVEDMSGHFLKFRTQTDPEDPLIGIAYPKAWANLNGKGIRKESYRVDLTYLLTVRLVELLVEERNKCTNRIIISNIDAAIFRLILLSKNLDAWGNVSSLFPSEIIKKKLTEWPSDMSEVIEKKLIDIRSILLAGAEITKQIKYVEEEILPNWEFNGRRFLADRKQYIELIRTTYLGVEEVERQERERKRRIQLGWSAELVEMAILPIICRAGNPFL